jgi:anti-sigma B factor antagonist
MQTPSQFEINVELTDGVARVRVAGELDIATVPRLEEKARALLSEGAERLVIDLRELSFVDSSGLSLFIALAKRAAQEQWTLSLTRPPERVFSVFRITGTDTNLPFVEDSA